MTDRFSLTTPRLAQPQPGAIYHDAAVFVTHSYSDTLREPRPAHDPTAYTFDFVDAGRLWLWSPVNACLGVVQGEYSLMIPDDDREVYFEEQAHALTLTLPAHEVVDIAREARIGQPAVAMRPAIRTATEPLCAMLRAIVGEFSHPAPGSALMLQSLRTQLIIHLLRDQAHVLEWDPVRDTAGLPPEIRRSVDFIHAYLGDDLTLDQVAAVAALSRYHFVRRFKRFTGLTPHAYLRQARLAQAAARLRETHDSVAVIAYRLGFASPGHLASAFRQRYGVSPSAYRAERRRNSLP
ncbi:MAG TPA: AraC family transcriptional regulator [Anaerolineae bacterium]